MLVERRRLAALMSNLLYRLAGARAHAGDIDGAIEAAKRLTAFYSLREDGHRLLVRLLAQLGQRGAPFEAIRTLRR